MEIQFDIAEDELNIFLAEANEHLQVLDEGLVRLEHEGQAPALLQSLFRAAHTLKGSAGAIGHRRMADLTHAMETVLDSLRKGAASSNVQLVDTLLAALDALRLLLNEVVDGQQSAVDVPLLVTRLSGCNSAALTEAGRSVPATEARIEVGNGRAGAQGGKNQAGPRTNGRAGRLKKAGRTPATQQTVVAIQAEFAPRCFASAARAFQVMLALQDLGRIVHMDPDQTALETSAPVQHLTVQLETTKPTSVIQEALVSIPDLGRLVVGDASIELSAPPAASAGRSADQAVSSDSVEEGAQRLGDYLVKAGYITPFQLQAAVQAQAADAEPHALLGQKLVRMGYLSQEALDRAIVQQIAQMRSALRAAADKGRTRATEQTVRTSVERLDSLMNLVGELITGRNRLYQLHRNFERRWRGEALIDELSEAALGLGRLTDQLQEEVMRIRMLPVSNVFNKFPRLVRDLARQTGKQVDLVMRGEDTELDRSVIESISDPLIHMLRNAVDHGLETPAERVAAGKPERGTILLTARHEEGRISLTVEDDGHGIDPERVKANAVRKGLLTEGEAAALTVAQAIDLIFTPGLSTAKTVSDLSGRGVGLDIVRSNVERLNGTIAVETRPGHGTKFHVALPLTLAIIPALLVQAEGAGPEAGAPIFAIPLPSVMEALQVAPDDVHTVNGRPVIQLRGSLLPLLRLDEALGFRRTRAEAAPAREYVVAVRWGQATMGLRVNRLVGEQEIVIKSLGALVGESVGVAGAAILGDGQIALIVDVPGLFKLAGA